MRTARRRLLLPLLAASALCAPGCIVIPIGDLLRGPPLGEQTLLEGAGWCSKDKIAVIDVSGTILAEERSSLLFPRENTLAETKARLDLARSDPQVKAVVLRISSPGGEVTACDVLAREIRSFKGDRKVPVVACITDIGASGGYYVASAADTIHAQPTAMVGSIGVILQSFDLSGLMATIGVANAPVKSSPQKDLNSPFRPMTEEERAVLQKLVDDMYERFLGVVAEGRPGLSKDDLRRVADGRVVSGTEAKNLGLVDAVGYLSDAIEEARKRADIDSPTIVRYTRAARSGANIYSLADLGRASDGPDRGGGGIHLSLDAPLDATPRLYYLWRPGF